MLLEAVDRPFRFHFADGQVVRLTPGEPINLPDEQAYRLLTKAPSKVKVITVTEPPPPVSNAQADRKDSGDKAPLFPIEMPLLAPGAVISWKGADGKIRGPVTVEDVTTTADGYRWVWVRYDGLERAISERVIQQHST